MPILYTTCARDCYDACRMVVETNQSGEIVSIKGDIQHPVTKGFLCPRGNKDVERVYKNRVDTNYIRKEGKYEKANFSEAIDTVANKTKEIIEKYGAKSILYIDFAGNEGLVHNIFARRLWNFLGVKFTDQALCTATGHLGIGLHYGQTYGIQADEISSKKLIVFWGFNAAVSSMHIWKMAVDAKKNNNAKIVVIDPICSASAKNADFYFQINPSTDVLLAYCVMKIIIENSNHEISFIEKYTFGFEKLKQKTEIISFEYVIQQTGLSKTHIQQLAQLYIDAGKESATMIGVSLQKRIGGAEQVRSISLIPALMGIHRGFLYSNSQALMVDTDFISGKFLNNFQKQLPMVSIAENINNGLVKMLVINSMNPAVSLPNSNAFIQSIDKHKPFVVVNETHWSETAQIADVIFAVPTFLEKEDIMLSWFHNYVSTSQCCSKRLTDSHTEVEIMQNIAKKMQIDNDDVLADYHKVIKLAFTKALENSDKLFESTQIIQMKVKPKNIYKTPSGKIEFCSSKASELGYSELPEYIQTNKKSDEFVLLTTAMHKYTNSQFVEVFGEVEKNVLINEADAKELSIFDNEQIIVYNNLAKLTFIAKISEDICRGVVKVGRFAKDLNDMPVNCLIYGETQKISNGPIFHSTVVKLSKNQSFKST